ncbi:hypothetical protein GEMRC1_012485 [Eukaryota sp. GEM-RC1]
MADASDKAIGGIVFAESPPFHPNKPFDQRKLKPLSFYSLTLTDAQRKWSTIEKELFALVRTITQPSLSTFLLSIHFYLYTDHRNLTYLRTEALKNPMLKRWEIAISEYQFTITNASGITNCWADMLSRVISPKDSDVINQIENDETLENYLVHRDQTAPVPPHLRKPLIHSVHYSLFTGHPTTKDTISYLKNIVFTGILWLTMFKTTLLFVMYAKKQILYPLNLLNLLVHFSLTNLLLLYIWTSYSFQLIMTEIPTFLLLWIALPALQYFAL